MLVGVASLDYDEIQRYINKPEDMVAYVEKLVPVWAMHIPGIIDNQRYLAALQIRRLLSIPYKKRKALTDALVDGIQISGIMSSVVSIYDLVNECDKDELIEMFRREIANER